MASKAPCTLSLSSRVLFRSKQPGRGRQGDAAGCAAPLDKVVPVGAIGPQCGWGEGEAVPASAARLVRMVAGREAAAGKVSGSMTAVLPGSSQDLQGRWLALVRVAYRAFCSCALFAGCMARQINCLNRLPFSLCSRGGRQAKHPDPGPNGRVRTIRTRSRFHTLPQPGRDHRSSDVHFVFGSVCA